MTSEKTQTQLKIRKIIGLVPENVGFSEELTAYDNLDFYGQIYDCSDSSKERKQ